MRQTVYCAKRILKTPDCGKKPFKFIFLINVYFRVGANCDMLIGANLGTPTILVSPISAVFDKLKPRTVVCYAWNINI